MKRKRRMTYRQRSNPENVATWLAWALLGLFVVTYIAALILVWLRPADARLAEIMGQLLTVLAPVLRLVMGWYLGRRKQGPDD